MLCVVLVAFVTISSLRLLPVDLRPVVGHLFPEGWELFTADPRVPRFEVAIERGGRWVDADRGPLAKPSNAFGLNRAVRWQAVEVSRLVAEAPGLDAWTPCDERPLRCLARAERGRVRPVRNTTPYHTLCGRIGLVRQLIRSPDDAPSRGSARAPTHVIVVDARCSRSSR